MDKEHEDTKPIKVLSDIEQPMTREEKNADIDNEEALSRTMKFKLLEEEEESKSQEELAEEALAEKNINEAEALLAEEENKEEIEEDNKDKKKENLIEKFKKLPKKKKIIIIVSGIFVLLLIIALIVFLIIHGGKNNNTSEEKQDEKMPVIVDNFYYKDGYLYFLNSKEDEIGKYECANKDENLCYVAYNKYRDNFNTDLILKEDGSESNIRVPIFNEDYVFIYDNKSENENNIVMHSIKQDKELDTYGDVKAYDDGYVVYSDLSTNKYGLMKIDEGTISNNISPTYEYLGMIDGRENLVAKTGKGYVVIDDSGKELSSAVSSDLSIMDYSIDLIVGKIGEDVNVYDFDADLVSGGYKHASVIDGYMALIDSNNKLYVRDKNGNKFNEEGIELKNTEYVRVYTYNETKKSYDIKQSYGLELKDEAVVVAVYPSDYSDPKYTSLNLDQVAANKNYKYMNYFNGKLYFYKDDNKNDLIGTYSCSNSNAIDGDGKLSSCYPAYESYYEDNEGYSRSKKDDFIIPMLYSKYVFINDGSNNVNLYDLNENKVRGTYTSVSTYISNTDGSFTNLDESIEFIALNKKGKYGVVNLTKDNASVKISFDYNKIERFKDSYYLAQNSENKWLIIYKEANSLSTTFDNKIQDVVNKEYFKVGKDGSYIVYKNNGGKASDTTFKYVKLYSDYFIGVENNKLNVYDYTGKKLGGEGTSVNSTSCSVGEFATSVKSGNSYVVSVCTNGDKYDKVTLTNSVATTPSDDNNNNNNNNVETTPNGSNQ